DAREVRAQLRGVEGAEPARADGSSAPALDRPACGVGGALERWGDQPDRRARERGPGEAHAPPERPARRARGTDRRGPQGLGGGAEVRSRERGAGRRRAERRREAPAELAPAPTDARVRAARARRLVESRRL